MTGLLCPAQATLPEAAAARIADAPQVEGVFGNPRIEPFGPEEEA